MLRAIPSYLVVGISLALVAGCGSMGAGITEQLVPVSGTVTFEEAPVEGAIVNFIPVGSNSAHQGSGVTDHEGQFEMANYQNKAGLPAGSYVVTFSLWRLPDGSAPPNDVPPASSQAVQAIPPLWREISKAGPHNKLTIGEDGKTDLVFKILKDARVTPVETRPMMR